MTQESTEQTPKNILHLGSAIVNLDHIAVMFETSEEDGPTAVTLILANGEYKLFELPKGKNLSDYEV